MPWLLRLPSTGDESGNGALLPGSVRPASLTDTAWPPTSRPSTWKADDRSMAARLERLARAETVTVAMVRASPIRKPVTVDDASLTTAPVTGSRRASALVATCRNDAWSLAAPPVAVAAERYSSLLAWSSQ